MPKISVVMPVYNGELYLKEAIDSILSQTYTDFEFIIVNDGSTDNTEDIIKSYTDSRIIYLKNEVNLGIVDTLNKGLDAAKGEYIARMDADDISMPTRFEKQLSVMESDSTLGVLGTGTRIFGDGIETVDTHSMLNPQKLKAELIFSTNLCHPSVMMRKSVLDKYHIRYQKEYRGVEDFEIWWQLSQVTKMIAIPDVLLCYRIHPSQVTQTKDSNHINLLSMMLEHELEILGVSLSCDEKKAFLLYCTRDFKSFSQAKFCYFIDALEKFLIQNKKTHFFKQSALKDICGSAVIRTLNDSKNLKDVYVKLYKLAIGKNIIPIIMRIKLSVHKILGR